MGKSSHWFLIRRVVFIIYTVQMRGGSGGWGRRNVVQISLTITISSLPERGGDIETGCAYYIVARMANIFRDIRMPYVQRRGDA